MDGPTHLQEILTGRKRRGRTTPWPVYLVLLLALLGGGGWWLRTQVAAQAGPAGEVDTDICDKLLTAASEAQPGQFLFCASRKKTIYKIAAGRIASRCWCWPTRRSMPWIWITGPGSRACPPATCAMA